MRRRASEEGVVRHRAAAEGVVPLQVSVGVGELRRVVAVGRGRPAAVEARDPLGVVVVVGRRQEGEVVGRVPLGEVVAEERQRRRVEAL